MELKYDYDMEIDAFTVDVGMKKADVTIELAEHILVDITNDGKLVGLEILDASEALSKIFGRVVSKSEIRQLLCNITQESKSEYLIEFRSPQKKQSVNLFVPLYKSPVLSGN